MMKGKEGYLARNREEIRSERNAHACDRRTTQEAKRAIVRQVEQGTPVADARRWSPVLMHRTTVYRLLKRAQSEGEQASIEGVTDTPSSYMERCSPG